MLRYIALIVGLLIVPTAVQAHKVIFAIYDEGDAVEGEIGFSNGDPAAEALIEYFDVGGRKLGQIKSDQEGLFKLPLSGEGIFTFKADLGAGHMAEVVLNREEGPPKTASKVEPKTGMGAIPSADLEQMIERGIARQIKPLRKELAAYKEENDLQKTLGGLGYIFGLAGVGFYLAARHKLQSARKAREL